MAVVATGSGSGCEQGRWLERWLFLGSSKDWSFEKVRDIDWTAFRKGMEYTYISKSNISKLNNRYFCNSLF